MASTSMAFVSQVGGVGFPFKIRGFSSSIGNLVGMFPLSLELEYLVIPGINIGGDGVHGVDSPH